MKSACLTVFAAWRGASLFTVLATFAGAQNQTWMRQFGTTGSDWAAAVAADGVGGVYVSGNTLGSLGGSGAWSWHAWLTRYDNAGNQTWIREFGTSNDDGSYAAAPDGSGGVYVSGSTTGSLGGPNAGSDDVWLAHYDGAGNQIWMRQFGTTGSDWAPAAAVDGVGGVFVSGTTLGSLGGLSTGLQDAWLAHYDSAGNQTWMRQFGTTSNDKTNAVAADGAGGVYVSGITFGSLGGPNAGNGDAWLAHYDGAGNQTWMRQLGTTGSDWADAAAADGVGGVYVSGTTLGSLGGPSAGFRDAWLAHYDSAGNQTWMRQFGTTRRDSAYAAAPDGAGGVYVSGMTFGNLGGPNAGSDDVWLAHYNGAGNQIWMRQFGTTGGESAYAAAPDGSGGVYLGGYTDGSLGGPNAGSNDAWVTHFGDLLATRFCTPAIANSTGQPGVLTAIGSNQVSTNNLTVTADQLPANSFGFFLTSRDQGSTFPVSNSQGRLCLGGFIGRYVGPGQIQNSGSGGSFSLVLDLTAMAHPVNPVAVQPGDTWNLQAWHRDANPTLTSNFTDAISVTFQ